jgi:hypothetical protein
VVGAVCGGLYAYALEHLLSKDQLARIGTRLPAPSSVLLTFTETAHPRRLLDAAASQKPSVASVAAIGDDFSASVFTSLAASAESQPAPAAIGQPVLLSILVVRYEDPDTARQMAARVSSRPTSTNAAAVELVASADRGGRRQVEDPTHGTAAMARSNVVSWGLFGLIFGALAAAIGGGGILGFLGGGLLTGIGWGAFGLIAGALYGRWAGQAISARRLKALGRLLAPGTSMLLAWAEGPVSQDSLDMSSRLARGVWSCTSLQSKVAHSSKSRDHARPRGSVSPNPRAVPTNRPLELASLWRT